MAKRFRRTKIEEVRKSEGFLVRDRLLFMWEGGGGDFFCFSMKEKT